MTADERAGSYLVLAVFLVGFACGLFTAIGVRLMFVFGVATVVITSYFVVAAARQIWKGQ